MTAKGQLQHHFWSNYCATIALVFDSAADASHAQARYLPTWKIGQKHANVLVFHGADPELENTLLALESDRRQSPQGRIAGEVDRLWGTL